MLVPGIFRIRLGGEVFHQVETKSRVVVCCLLVAYQNQNLRVSLINLKQHSCCCGCPFTFVNFCDKIRIKFRFIVKLKKNKILLSRKKFPVFSVFSVPIWFSLFLSHLFKS